MITGRDRAAMLNEPTRIKLESDADILRVVRGVIADGEPRVLEREGEAVAVLLSPVDYAALSHGLADDPWIGYEPKRARQGLAAAANAFVGVDRDELRRDVREARGQASSGRPS